MFEVLSHNMEIFPDTDKDNIYISNFNSVTSTDAVLLCYQSEMGLKAQKSISAFWKMNSRTGYSVQLAMRVCN